jgi:hypothetical protein
MVVEINHHWVTFKLPGTETEFRAKYSEYGSSKKFVVEKRSAEGRWVSAFSRIVGAKAK